MVYVSLDPKEEVFMKYFRESMNWSAHPYDENRQKLAAKFKVSGIPSLVVCDSEGRVLTNKGKEDISASTLKFFRSPRSNTQKAQDSLRVLSLVRNYVLVSILGPEEGHFDVLETKSMSTVKTSRSELG